MAFVDPGVVAELCDPTLGTTISTASVHQSVDHQQGDHGVGVAIHSLHGNTQIIKI